MSREYKKTILDNGLRVLSLPLKERKGVAVGVWLDVGSRDDPPGHEGIAHLVEHLMFKGTENRTALEIAKELEIVGGTGDAYTSREETCYYAYLPATELPLALDIIGDMIAHSKIEEESFRRETGVVLAEMAEIEDSPPETAQEMFAEILFGDHPLGRPILGTPNGVTSSTREDILGFIQENYISGKAVVAAVGNVDHEQLCRLASEYIILPNGSTGNGRTKPVELSAKEFRLIRKDCGMVNCILGGRIFPYRDERRYPLAILDKLLGVGPSSQLFNRIREEAGIGYDVHSFVEYFQDCGMWGVFGAFEAKSASRFFKLLRDILDDLAGESIDRITFDETINGLCGRLLLQQDSMSSMLNRLAENELHLGRFISVEESIERLHAVTPDDVRDLAAELFALESISGLALGPVNDKTRPDWLGTG